MAQHSTTLPDHYAAHFRKYLWTHFCTLTAPTTGDDRLVKAFSQMIRRLERVAQGPVEYLWVRERGARAGTPHLHALLAGTGHLSTDRVARAWRLGFADVEHYLPHLGGAFYVTKSMFSDDELWDCSPGLGRAAIDRASMSRPGGAAGSSAPTWSVDDLPDLPL